MHQTLWMQQNGLKRDSTHEGQDYESFHAETLPKGMFVSVDYMATSTFNGALESGVNAGRVASTF